MTSSGTAVAFSWSGGKDSAHALGRLLDDPRYDVQLLLCTVDAATQKSSVHDVPVALLQAQADAIGIELHTVALADPGLTDYPARISAAATACRAAGIEAIAFGDLGHSGALSMREAQFAPLGLAVIEPLIEITTTECIARYLATGIEAFTVAVNADVLGRHHVGVAVDASFVASLPAGCDPNGETGEYHSFVWNAPWFAQPVAYSVGEPFRLTRTIGTDGGPQEFHYWHVPLAVPQRVSVS